MIDQTTLDEIRRLAEKNKSGGYESLCPMQPDDVLAILDALGKAQRAKENALRSCRFAEQCMASWNEEHNALLEILSPVGRDLPILERARKMAAERDTLRAEVERLREALKDAQTELFEAADKFHVIGINHPGSRLCNMKLSLTAKHLDEDKEFMAKLADRMTLAARRARTAYEGKETGDD